MYADAKTTTANDGNRTTHLLQDLRVHVKTLSQISLTTTERHEIVNNLWDVVFSVAECFVFGLYPLQNSEEKQFLSFLKELCEKEPSSHLATITIPFITTNIASTSFSVEHSFVLSSLSQKLLSQHFELMERNNDTTSKYYEQDSIISGQINRLAFGAILVNLESIQIAGDVLAELNTRSPSSKRGKRELSVSFATTPARAANIDGSPAQQLSIISEEITPPPNSVHRKSLSFAEKENRFSATVSPLSYYFQDIQKESERSSQLLPPSPLFTKSSSSSAKGGSAAGVSSNSFQDSDSNIVHRRVTSKPKHSNTLSGIILDESRQDYEGSISGPPSENSAIQSAAKIEGSLADIPLYECYFSDVVLKSGEIQAPRISSRVYMPKLNLHYDVYEPGTRDSDACFSCNYKFDGIFFRPRFCYYSGGYFCSRCHINEKSIIPGRVVHLWDFELYPVCNLAKEVIMNIASTPVLNIEEMDPERFNRTDTLKQSKALRNCIYRCNDYISTCQHSETLAAFLGDRLYMLFSPNEYALVDLVDLVKGHLIPHLTYVAQHFQDHILNSCEGCKNKGDYCEICHSGSLLFSFQTESTSQCLGCGSFLHRHCLNSVRKCLKCDRLQKRRNRSQLLDLK
eukprot:TRINITY_DN9456_c0_g1_i1.p1 TRINITY_DN9456_c0_g1~~TRINITY_DN9456_c0_g1_i1.p1  ORF type:complete len:627 (+),score=103.86 TRINITY_DN9456_c0_g1_i1:46-1926(+)